MVDALAGRGGGYSVWYVYPSGNVGSYLLAAHYSFTLAPACAISVI